MIMKLKGFIITAVAAVAALAACQNKENLDTSKFELSTSTLNFGTEADSQTLTLTSGKAWKAEYADGVEWVSVTPKSGSASAEPQTITITVTPNDVYERATTITFTNGLVKEKLTIKQAGNNESVTTPTLDPTKTYAFRKTDKLVSGQAYVMVATKNDKLWACNDPSSDATNFSKGYAYPKGLEVEDVNGEVSVVGAAAYVFKASADGFTMMNYGSKKYILQTGTHVSFNLADAPADGAYWDVTKNDDGTFKILNKTVSKFVVMQSSYDSFGLSQYADGGTMPWLYEYVGEGVAPEYKEMTIEQFYTTSESYVTVKAKVVAVGAKTMVLNDGTSKSLYVYVDKDPAVAVGDVVKVDGLKSTYGKADAGYTPLKQLKNVTITKINDAISANDLPALVLTSAQIDAPYSNEATSLVTIEGTVVKDGNYINLELDGTVLGSVVESAKGSELPEGVRLSITGYYAGINSKGYFCILPTAYSYSNTPFFNVPTTNVEVSASATSAAIAVKGNVEWAASCETAGFTLDKTSGTGEATITVTFAANETDQPKTATVKIATSAEVATKEYTVTINQAKFSDEFEIVLSAETRPCDTFPNETAGETTTKSYIIDGYEWTFSPSSSSNKFTWYPTDKYILWGKQGGYILMPSVEGRRLTSVTILTGKGASTKVNVGVFDAEGKAAVKGGEAIVLSAQNSEFSWTLTDTEVGARYQLRITSAHNAQLQKLTLKYE